jgi:hypothetical protein
MTDWDDFIERCKRGDTTQDDGVSLDQLKSELQEPPKWARPFPGAPVSGPTGKQRAFLVKHSHLSESKVNDLTFEEASTMIGEIMDEWELERRNQF